MIEYKPPYNIRNLDLFGRSIILAGSNEMGKAIDWQQEIVDLLKDEDVIILNPRRDNWDSSWIQSIDNPQFREQVEWELYGVENATMILMCFMPNTISPISMLELGLCIKNRNVIVYCPNEFHRKGNIDVTCALYRVPVFDDFELFKEKIKGMFAKIGK